MQKKKDLLILPEMTWLFFSAGSEPSPAGLHCVFSFDTCNCVSCLRLKGMRFPSPKYVYACDLLTLLLTYSIKQSPSSEAHRFSASQEIPHFMEHECSLSHSQVPATFPCPDLSSVTTT
jgi:hypothetical protein